MAQVTVTLNGRTYRLECDNGEEQHLLTLAGEMGQHIELLKARFGQVGDDRLLVMAALMIADELSDTRQQLEEAKDLLSAIRNDKASASEIERSAQSRIANKISAAADRIEALNDRFTRGGRKPG